ncbi:MAG TPA: hypothetical protein V6D08_15030 [Candidatus Obscuribacterales bacterium]
MDNSTTNARGPTSTGFHLVAGPGGSRAILGVAGALMAIEQSKLKDQIVTEGGISGGSIPLFLHAMRVPVSRIVAIAAELEFHSLLEKHRSTSDVMVPHLWKNRYSGMRPKQGVYKTLKLKEWADSFGSAWPERYWTMAVMDCDGMSESNDGQREPLTMFTREGIFLSRPDGTFEKLCAPVLTPGQAIQATCAVPGVIDPFAFSLPDGRELLLFDGGLGPEGRRPISIPRQCFGAQWQDLILIDVGPEVSTIDLTFNRLWRWICGGRCVPLTTKKRTEEEKMLLIEPEITQVRSFEFNAPRDRKWQAIMTGYGSALMALEKARLIEDAALSQGKDLVAQFLIIVADCRKTKEGELALRTEKLLAESSLV